VHIQRGNRVPGLTTSGKSEKDIFLVPFSALDETAKPASPKGHIRAIEDD
jgi:hypothetical protein